MTSLAKIRLNIYIVLCSFEPNIYMIVIKVYKVYVLHYFHMQVCRVCKGVQWLKIHLRRSVLRLINILLSVQ